MKPRKRGCKVSQVNQRCEVESDGRVAYLIQRENAWTTNASVSVSEKLFRHGDKVKVTIELVERMEDSQ